MKEKLKALGADTEDGISRCFGNEELYMKLVRMVPKEKAFDTLESSIAANDLDAAFEAAHALKGVLGNLSLTPMYELTCRLTELLRARTETDYKPMLTELLSMRDELAEACG